MEGAWGFFDNLFVISFSSLFDDSERGVWVICFFVFFLDTFAGMAGRDGRDTRIEMGKIGTHGVCFSAMGFRCCHAPPSGRKKRGI